MMERAIRISKFPNDMSNQHLNSRDTFLESLCAVSIRAFVYSNEFVHKITNTANRWPLCSCVCARCAKHTKSFSLQLIHFRSIE